ncbi:hypothetical protein Hanom_Chr00s000003g01603351 [Helianthus anomalus]
MYYNPKVNMKTSFCNMKSVFSYYKMNIIFTFFLNYSSFLPSSFAILHLQLAPVHARPALVPALVPTVQNELPYFFGPLFLFPTLLELF